MFDWAQFGWTIGILVLILSIPLTYLYKNRIFSIPRIRVIRTYDNDKEWVAKVRGYYSYQAFGNTKAEAIGNLMLLIDDLKHKPNNRIVNG